MPENRDQADLMRIRVFKGLDELHFKFGLEKKEIARLAGEWQSKVSAWFSPDGKPGNYDERKCPPADNWETLRWNALIEYGINIYIIPVGHVMTTEDLPPVVTNGTYEDECVDLHAAAVDLHRAHYAGCSEAEDEAIELVENTLLRLKKERIQIQGARAAQQEVRYPAGDGR